MNEELMSVKREGNSIIPARRCPNGDGEQSDVFCPSALRDADSGGPSRRTNGGNLMTEREDVTSPRREEEHGITWKTGD